MTRILFLHHQQRRHFTEEPGYNEVYRVFEAADLGLHLDGFVYQSILRHLLDMEGMKAKLEGRPDDELSWWVMANNNMAEILDQVLCQYRPDLIVNMSSWVGGSLHPGVFSMLRDAGHRFKVVTIFFDVGEQYPMTMMQLQMSLDNCDRVLLCDDENFYLRLITRQGPFAKFTNVERAFFQPLSIDPRLFQKRDEVKIHDIVIFGSSEDRRIHYVNALGERYGDRFRKLGGYMPEDTFLSFDDYVLAINQTKIIVNTQTREERDQIKGRIKEVLSCGGFLIDQATPNTRRYFADAPVPLFSDLDDLFAKIDYYLDHDDERDAIAQASHDWMVARHSPQGFVRAVLGAVDLA